MSCSSGIQLLRVSNLKYLYVYPFSFARAYCAPCPLCCEASFGFRSLPGVFAFGSPWSVGFVRVLLFPKLVLRSPPRAGRKKRYLVGALLQDRLKQWMSGTGISDLWCAACAEGTLPNSSAAGDLAASNIRRAIQWALEGRYGNALKALGSLGVASFDDASAKEELLRRHPQSELPSPSSSAPAPLTVQRSPLLFSQLYALSKGALLLVALHSVLNTFWMLFVALLLPRPLSA